MEVVTYAGLASEWMRLKNAETKLQAELLDVELQLMEFFVLPEEGERSLKLDGFKTTAKAGINISIADQPAFKSALSAGLLPPQILETKLYDTGFKKLRRLAVTQDEEALKLYSSILPLFNVRPAKVGFTVVRYE